MSTSLRIAFVGAAWVGSNARSLAEGFRDLGHDVRLVDTSAATHPSRLSRAYISRRLRGRIDSREQARIARELQVVVQDGPIDLLVAFKTIHLPQDPLLNIRARHRIHYSPDDMRNADNLTQGYLEAESQWDLLVTTKSFNVSELEERSGVPTQLVWSAYDPRWHFRAPRRGSRLPIMFIGNPRPDRLGLFADLPDDVAAQLHVLGPDWGWRHRSRIRPATPHGPVYGQEFSYAVARGGVHLVLLNSENRDLHTCRSFEIAAAGGLVLAERTVEHSAMFEEGSEALMFSGPDELVDVARSARQAAYLPAVAESGWRRVTSQGNTYADRAGEIIERVRQS